MQLTDQTGKTFLITGATGGIGRAAALALLGAGATVMAVGRSRDKLAALAAAAGAGGRLVPLRCDLSEVAQVRDLAQRVRAQTGRLDVLVNNAGAIFRTRGVTAEGLERTFAVNHLAYFVLTTELLPLLEASAPARVICTASDAHKIGRIDLDNLQLATGYTRLGFTAYGNSKLMNILFTRALARHMAGRGVRAACFHPGFVGSGMGRNNGWLAEAIMWVSQPLQRTPEQGAQTLLWLATAPPAQWQSGAYYVDRAAQQPAKAALDDETARRLWDASAQLVARLAAPA